MAKPKYEYTALIGRWPPVERVEIIYVCLKHDPPVEGPCEHDEDE